MRRVREERRRQRPPGKEELREVEGEREGQVPGVDKGTRRDWRSVWYYHPPSLSH